MLCGVDRTADLNHTEFSFHIKSVDTDQRTIEGLASTPTPDRIGHVMDPAGAKFALPMPLLWNHNHDRPIGHVITARPTAKGIYIKAQISRGVLPFIDEAWALIKGGLTRGLSIGFRPTAPPEMLLDKGKSSGMLFKAWDWFETSVVTVPMNAETMIAAVKSAEAATRAALSSPPARRDPPGVPGRPTGQTMTTSEQITHEKSALQVDTNRLEELETAETAGTLTDEDSTERDRLQQSIDARVKKIQRLATMESAAALFAQPVGVPANGQTLAPARGRVEIVKKELPKGTGFTRYVMAMARAHGEPFIALQYAKQWDHETPEVSAYIKAAAGTATGGSPAWGATLVEPTNLASEFISLLMPQTVIGRIEGFRRVPFNVRMVEQTGGATVNWVGELAVKPVGENDYAEVLLTYAKIAGIVVLSEELVRLSTPAAEEVVRRDLTEQIQKFMDEQFLNPSVAATANNPASITNGVTPISASAATAAALRADLTDAIQVFTAANIPLDSVHIVMHGNIAAGIAGFTTTLSAPEFPGMSPRGGTLMGFPVIVSNATQSDDIVLLAASEIFLADDGRVTIDASREATLDMAGGSSPTYSLWQRNAVGIRAERWITWKKRRSAAVTYINGSAYEP